jgi:hypothetical protein
MRKKAEIHSVFADYNVSNLDRDPFFSAVLENINFSPLPFRSISGFLQSANFLSSFVGLSNFRPVVDCLVDLQMRPTPFLLELKERIKADAANAASESIGEDIGRQLNDRSDEPKSSRP